MIVLVASRIEAVIYDGGGRPAGLSREWRAVPLLAGLTLVPVTEDMAVRLDQGAVGGDRIRAGWMLRPPVAALARGLSAGRRVLYIVGETFAGTGAQEAIGWQDERLLYGPSGSCDLEADREPGYDVVTRADSAINRGLRALGVRAGPGQDEYQAAGLDRHRWTEDWT